MLHSWNRDKHNEDRSKEQLIHSIIIRAVEKLLRQDGGESGGLRGEKWCYPERK